MSGQSFDPAPRGQDCLPDTFRAPRARSGRYTGTFRYYSGPVWVRTGMLGADALAAVRAAHQRAVARGLEARACRDGRRPQVIAVSAGGYPAMRLTSHGRTIAPPTDSGCWSDAAVYSARLMAIAFNSPTGRRR
jgi:hypothetical protein